MNWFVCTTWAGHLVRARKHHLASHSLSSEPPTGWAENIPIADAPLRIHARNDDTAVGPQGQEAVEDVIALYGADGEAVPPNPAFVNSLEQWQAVDAQDYQGAWFQVRWAYCVLGL